MIYVFGHQSPDTDATASAIVWANFLRTVRGQDAQAFVLGTPNKEALFVLKHWGHETPELLESINTGDQVAIVDTNNHEELFPNINDAHIVSIIDHHKLTGGLETNSPREIVIQPYASTMTVLFTVMNLAVEQIDRSIAGLMLSGILSDTLAFRSPTTTDRDKELAENLARTLDVDIVEYAQQMFDAKSDISDMSDEELIDMDSKRITIEGKELRVSVVETTNPETVMQRKETIMRSIVERTESEKLHGLLFFVVDILNEQSQLFVSGETVRRIANQSFVADTVDDVMLLPGVVSRKKQIIPALQI